MRLRVLVTFLLLILSCVSGFCQNQNQEPLMIEIKEQKPLFDNDVIGGKFTKWVSDHVRTDIRCPRNALKKGALVRVSIGFTITKDGKLTDIDVLMGAHPLLDEEAVRVIKEAPQKWTCGYNYKGEPIDTKIVYPVFFKF